ncbi:phytanoyl-CoA dioxygenase family protein [Penicillium soppii]|uniref:phytanoyl-CoA dioxygenase family protein n=1 Tax=Penicillium soppii TaxID=69789 RepID=UPI0025498429|nr:phytanoyl-CoA dioxygenase family protein [Penicillium soppii]KAJ5871665.1 phytanoyl-CoA dioxygenase family protein [Penicillium soppii]
MTIIPQKYGPGLQYVPSNAPIEDILFLMKRDGGIVVKGLVSTEDIDKAHADVREALDGDAEWNGDFFPKETKRASSLLAKSSTYAKTQVMNPVFQAVCAHFLTTRSTFWWGDKQKESVSKPYIQSTTAIEIGPGGKAQPLHRDSYINHNILTEVSEWDDVRDRTRECSLGMMAAGCKVTKQNGGTQFIPGSHLWSTERGPSPNAKDCVTPEMDKGDAFIMLSSVYHGGGENTTTDQYRLAFATFAIRGYLRQEENQYLAIPREVVKEHDRETQQFMGYYMSEPACGYVEQLDPIYVLYPELLKDAKLEDF